MYKSRLDNDIGSDLMKFDYYEYNISGHWISAIINNDYTGLEEREGKQLNQFMDSLPVIGHWDINDDNPSFRIDDISGLYSDTYSVKLLFEVQ